jgi:HlyD family secretion protein
MTANVRIVTDTRESALKVANAALRFRPPGESATPPDGRMSPEKPSPAGATGGGGQLTQLRERLVGELKLDETQQARLQAIFEQMRGRFASLRELPEEARARASATVRAEMRTGIEEILKPEQKPRFAEIMAEAAGRSAQSGRGRIWVLAGGKPTAIDVRTGLTDGTATEISGAGVEEGLEAITGVQGPANSAPAAKSGAPRMFF